MTTLVFLEHHHDPAGGAELQKGSLGVLAKALSLGGDVAGVVLGSGVGDAAAGAGAVKVFVCDDPALASPLPQPRVDALATLVARTGAETILFAASVLAADVAAGLAARLEAGINWDVTDLVVEDGELLAKRPALGDTVMVDAGWKGTPRIALVRSGAFDPAERAGTPEVEEFASELQEHSTLAELVGQEQEEASGPSIEDADVIVAGGRGLGAPEGFRLCEELAQALGGAVGATRAVVDAGWYPYSTQVGQTGKSVSPKLYIACGISGAIQHKVGMQGSGTIVAINKDPNAPIFDFADFGVVGKLEDVVPKLTELVRARRGG
ncbi:MAG TPA: electron transfer flavoprotein subunit alpha/FixB family protein [Gaiellaceae bacterium]